MPDNEDLFLQRYNSLNEQQREAVETIYGAIMVIAGPGTGKTEVLAMRIANLLRSEAQVQPQEILCLTYTEEATNAMRRRLVQVIGTAAHRVNIFTFHAFCNNVIQNNADYFGLRSLQPVSDLERNDILYKILENLPAGHLLRRLSGNIYFDTGKLNRLFEMMKKEHLTADGISKNIDEYLDSLPERREFIYQKNYKNYKKGEVKQVKLDEETRKMEETRAAANLFPQFETAMKDAGRYDFADMLLWTLEAFGNHPALLQSYQERYQFILVDEFQDTNGAQNELLNMLAAYWDDPNIFVVGDDDQGIYEFQGARIRNITDFYRRYEQNIKIVVLPHNYRSSQPILDSAMATIGNNKRRLINELHDLGLNKRIVSCAERFRDGRESLKPVVKYYPNILQEEADIVMQIEQLQKNHVALREVAILYSQHRQADNLVAMMERKGIPYNVKRPVDVLQEPLMMQLLNVLIYLDQERRKSFEGEATLFEIMHAPYYEIEPTDIAYLALHMQHSKKEKGPIHWRFMISNGMLLESLGLKSSLAMIRLGNNLDKWEREQLSLPLPMLVEKIVYESGMVAHLLRTADHVWQIQALYTFFEFVKESYLRDPKMKVGAFVQMVKRMEDENIAVALQRVVQNENGVHFYTAHSAKGNEFEYVFLIGCTKNFWENKRGMSNDYRMPDTITATEEDADKSYKTEVARRLYYVALTRAKKHLQVSYALADNLGKPLEASVFVDEISLPAQRQRQSVTQQQAVQHMEWAMQPVPETNIRLANGTYINRVLQNFSMSYSSLSKFLSCPLAFYYENILRVPFQKNDALAFGSAVHYALERLFEDMKLLKGVFPTREALLRAFDFGLKMESAAFTPVQYDRRLEQGHKLLGEYYDYYLPTFPKEVEIEYTVKRYYLEGVPVTGKIDRIELHGNTCKVVDYKTGDPDKSAHANVAPPNEKEQLGGDYWRQMVFYKLLLENYEERQWRVTSGMFDYLQKGRDGKYKQITVPVFQKDEEVVMGQLKEAYTRIMNHEFEKGCGKETCHWCNFARRYQLITQGREEQAEVDV